MTKSAELVSEMSDETLNISISQCIERLNELTAEDNSRKSLRVEKAKKEYDNAAKRLKEVADETNTPIMYRSIFSARI